MTFKYGVDQLTLDSVNAIAAGTLQAELCQEAIDKINKSRQNVDKMAASDKAIYGINTGFIHYVIHKFLQKKLTFYKRTY